MGSCHKVKKIHMTKIQPLFMIKTLRELGTERKAPNQTKSISRKATAKIILSGKRLRAMPPQMSPPKWVECSNKEVTKKAIQMANQHRKRGAISYVIQKMYM